MKKGTMQLVGRKCGTQVWVYRWREIGQDGKSQRLKKTIGLLSKFGTADAAWAEVERLGLGHSFDEFGPHNLEELARHFSEKELSEEEEDDDDPRRSSSTKDCYRLYLKNWIVPRWGKMPLSDIKALGVEEWLGQLRFPHDHKHKAGLKLARGSKKKIRDVMHVLYEHAIRCEWTTRNPITSVRQGGKRQAAPALIAIEDLSKLIWEVLDLRERALVLLDFGGGLRRGELAGVKWEDIDFEHGQVLPKRSIVSQVVGETKTEASSKPIPLDDSLLRELKLWRAETPYARDTDYVFASAKMKGRQPLWLDTLMRKVIKPTALKAGIHLKGWHTLRRTYSTLLKANGSDPKVVQELLRHASLKTTMDTYTQALSPEKRKAHRGVIRLVVPRQSKGAGPRRVPRSA